MANQNLSQFTEKLFVADADHTFIWDSAASISKRVSRNSWLNSGTLASDAPVTISQTWSTTNTYTAFKVVANETAVANISSNLLELWSGNAATLKVRVDKQGSIFFPSGQSIGNLNTSFVCGGGNFYPAGTLAGTSTLGTASVPFFAIWVGTSSNAAFLTSDAANTLALRNGANAQTFNVYGTYTSGTSYERLTLSAPSAANAIIGTNKGSGGGTARGLDLHTDGAARMTITTAGNVGIGTTAPGAKLQVNTNSNGLNFATVFYNENGTQGGNAVGCAFINETGNAPHYKAAIVHERTDTWARGKLHFLNSSNTAGVVALADARITIDMGGNVGIGTTSPTSKLQVTGGDVEIETVTSGIIMKAAGTATRYRITLNAGGTDLVFTAI